MNQTVCVYPIKANKKMRGLFYVCINKKENEHTRMQILSCSVRVDMVPTARTL